MSNPDINNIIRWQRDKDPESFTALFTRFNPIVTKFVNQYGTSGVNKDTLRTEAHTQLIKAFDTYDPRHATAPITHVYNSLKKLNRTANSSLTSGQIPETRRLKMATYKNTLDNLSDSLGREASASEMADELGWNIKEVERMNSELSGETTASNAEFDFFGNSTKSLDKNKELASYLYYELEGPEKVVFEHTFGYGGKPILKNREIAKKLKKNEVYVGRVKKKLTNKLKEYM